MSVIWSKSTWHAKKQENNEEKNQATETDPELTQVLEWRDKDMKTVIITVFRMFEKLNGDMKDIKKKKRTKSNL